MTDNSICGFSVNLNDAEIEATKRVCELKKSMEQDGIPFEPEAGKSKNSKQIELENAIQIQQNAIYENWHRRGGPDQITTLLMIHRIKERKKVSDPQLDINEIEATNKVNELKKRMQQDGIPFNPEPGQKKLKRQIELEKAMLEQEKAIYANWYDKGGPDAITNLLMQHNIKRTK